MENKLPNTIEKLLNRQSKIKYTSKKVIVKRVLWTIFIIISLVIIITALILGGAI